MTRAEALKLLHWLTWHLADAGYIGVAQQVEDVHLRLQVDGWTPSMCREFTKLLLPPGRPGRVTLVLHPRYAARGLLLLVGILRSVED